jgi:hypothetical protein
VQSFEPAYIAANHSELPHALANIPIKKRLYLFCCAHAFVQEHGKCTNKTNFIKISSSSSSSSSSVPLFTSMCKELGISEMIGAEAFSWFCLIPDFGVSLSNPFSGEAHYNYLTEESIRLGQGESKGGIGEGMKDAISTASKRAATAISQAQENRNSLKHAISAVVM